MKKFFFLAAVFCCSKSFAQNNFPELKGYQFCFLFFDSAKQQPGRFYFGKVDTVILQYKNAVDTIVLKIDKQTADKIYYSGTGKHNTISFASTDGTPFYQRLILNTWLYKLQTSTDYVP